MEADLDRFEGQAGNKENVAEKITDWDEPVLTFGQDKM